MLVVAVAVADGSAVGVGEDVGVTGVVVTVDVVVTVGVLVGVTVTVGVVVRVGVLVGVVVTVGVGVTVGVVVTVGVGVGVRVGVGVTVGVVVTVGVDVPGGVVTGAVVEAAAVGSVVGSTVVGSVVGSTVVGNVAGSTVNDRRAAGIARIGMRVRSEVAAEEMTGSALFGRAGEGVCGMAKGGLGVSLRVGAGTEDEPVSGTTTAGGSLGTSISLTVRVGMVKAITPAVIRTTAGSPAPILRQGSVIVRGRVLSDMSLPKDEPWGFDRHRLLTCTDPNLGASPSV